MMQRPAMILSTHVIIIMFLYNKLNYLHYQYFLHYLHSSYTIIQTFYTSIYTFYNIIQASKLLYILLTLSYKLTLVYIQYFLYYHTNFLLQYIYSYTIMLCKSFTHVIIKILLYNKLNYIYSQIYRTHPSAILIKNYKLIFLLILPL